MSDTTAADRMRELAEGPPLDLPPIRWEAPQVTWLGEAPYARWGDLGDHDDGLYLLASPSRIAMVHSAFLTLDQAERLLPRLAAAVALGRELEGTAGR